MAEQKKRLPIIQELKAEFKGVLNQLTFRHSYSEVWADFTEIAAIVVHQSAFMNPAVEEAFEQGLVSEEHVEQLRATTMPRDERWQRLEDKYMTYVPKYGADGMKLMTQLYAITSMAVEGHRCDFMGPLYMELDLSGSEQRGKRGEFFTPASLSDMMAYIQTLNIAEVLATQGYVRVQEPTCGAGGMLISFAAQMEQAGHDPRQLMYVEAVDINRTFFNMCYLQLSLLDIPARVWCGDSLLMRFDEMRETPQLMLSRYHWSKNPAFRMLQALRELELIGQQEDELTSAPVTREPLSSKLPAQGKGSCQPSILEGLEDGEDEQSLPEPIKAPPEAQVFETDNGGQFRLF